ncbi:MFS transporter [Actinomadura rupiterrae]|uniref:MFS transporter n=1 Tax=Actinomadura rupiterrae TaxID=559627 RepID=UPI0020A585FF|nr:MFS transporter [Actinomadura rupiterrae]MCP2340294.1 EmrB/QacA subfamily drug resistance transporter [Actinomadura rupiterrae]
MTRGRYRWALLVVAVSAFITTMDNTVVIQAIPTIRRDLGMSGSAGEWVTTGYMLMFSCLMVAGGRITDIYGCRVGFTTGMSVFTAASAACGLAPDDAILIISRVVQGAGAALALPATLVMVTVGRTDKQRSLGTIVWVGAGAAATALGGPIGASIVTYWSWSWIFLVNIVPGVLVIALGAVVLTSKAENEHAKVDMPGVLISATMLFALVYGLEAVQRDGWAARPVLGVFALALIALVCFVTVERWAPDPMIHLGFFRNRVFVGGLLSQMLQGMGFTAVLFYSASFMQDYLGFNAVKSSLVLLPAAFTIMSMTPVAFWLAARIGPRIAIGGGMGLMALGMAWFSTIRRGDGYTDLLPGVLTVGLGSALAMPIAMYVLKAIPDERTGVASGILNVIREASGAFGIAVVGVLVHDLPSHASAQALEKFRHGIASGLLLGAALVAVGGLISATTLPRKDVATAPKDEPVPVRAASRPVPEDVLVAAAVGGDRQPDARRGRTGRRGDRRPVNGQRPRVPETRRSPSYNGYEIGSQHPQPRGRYSLHSYLDENVRRGFPPPPEGWYRPYDPEDGEATGPHRVPRGDAW